MLIANKAGITGYKRVESLNDDPIFIKAMADVFSKHMDSGLTSSVQLQLRCPSCTSETCAETKKFFQNQA